MLVSCGGQSRTSGKGIIGWEGQHPHRRKTPRRGDRQWLQDRCMSYSSGWEYVAEGGANVVFRHKDSGANLLRVPKSHKFCEQAKLFEFLNELILPFMNNRDVFPKIDTISVGSVKNPHPIHTDSYYDCGKSKRGDYNCTRNHQGDEVGSYRLYGGLIKSTAATFLDGMNSVLCESKRPEHRRGSRLVQSQCPEPTWLMLLPNVVDIGEICIELKPKSSLGPHNTKHPKRYDQMAMKQRTCRYCMHQEWKVHNGDIPKRRPPCKAYCPMDLFSNDKGRMKKAIMALMDEPQNNYRVFMPDGKDITSELAASKKQTSATAAKSFRDLAGMEQEELMNVIVEGLCESRVLDDLHRAHELDELDIERIWALDRLITSSYNCDDFFKINQVNRPPSPSSEHEHEHEHEHEQEQHQEQKQFQFDPKTRRLLSEIDCTEESLWFDTRKRYRRALKMFLLAHTIKDCSILLSIRRKRSSREENQQKDEQWSEMEYRIECNGLVYWVLISIIDLDIKSEMNLRKYYKLDQDIVHHYSETYGLHKKFCFGQSFTENDDSVVQIKGNMMCRLLYPNPVCLLTVYDPTKHQANTMTITWLTAIDNHGTFVCSISKRRYTSELLRVSSIFVLNIPTRDMEDKILAIGSSTGRETDKFREIGLRTCCPGWFSGKDHRIHSRHKDSERIIKHAIALRDCIAHTVCLVDQKQDMGQHWLLVCKQQLAWSKKVYFADGKRFLRSSESLPPYLTFLGTQTFGSVV